LQRNEPDLVALGNFYCHFEAHALLPESNAGLDFVYQQYGRDFFNRHQISPFLSVDLSGLGQPNFPLPSDASLI
jgi:hypothetical protein